MSDSISRQAAIDALMSLTVYKSKREIVQAADKNENSWIGGVAECIDEIEDLPSAQQEPLTDKEQRIFLAAMGREEKVCEEVDRNYVREPYEDSLMRACKEIRRKVKGALWT